jgi:acyl dehydratase
MTTLDRNVAIGSELPEIAKHFRLEDFKRGDEKTIHTDYEAAAREGLPAPVAIGPQVAALLFRQLRLCFGMGWLVGGKCDLSFRRPVFVTDFCVARGTVTSITEENNNLRIDCDVWIENQDGAKVITGTASGLVPR